MKVSKSTIRDMVMLFEANQDQNVDEQNGVIHNVKVLGRHSKNDNGSREYSDEALDDAARMYERIGVNFDHPAPQDANRDRHFHEAIGQLRNVRREEDGVRGDLHVLKTHPHASMLFEAARIMPDRFGLSHNATGDVRRDANGKNVVVKLHGARSVDIVHKPATNSSLFESHSQQRSTSSMKTVKLARLLESHPTLVPVVKKAWRTGVLEAVAALPAQDGSDDQMTEDDQMQGYDQAAEAEDVPVDQDNDKDVDPGFLVQLLTMLVKLLGKSNTMERRMKESKFGADQTQGAPADMPAGAYSDSGAPGSGGAKGTGQAPKKKDAYFESIQAAVNAAVKPLMERVDSITNQLNAGKEDREINELIESLGRSPDAVLVKACKALPIADRKSLIESFPAKSTSRIVGGSRPATSFSVMESETPDVAIVPKSAADLGKALSRGGNNRAFAST